MFLQPVRAVCAWVEGGAPNVPLTYKAIDLFQKKFGFIRNFESVPKNDYQFKLAMNYEVAGIA